MAHLSDDRNRFDKTPTEWLHFGQQVGAQCNVWADRDDIVAFVGEGAGAGVAVACWAPAEAEMELNVKQAFGETITPDLVDDFTDRSTHFDHLHVAGAVLHEAMHARHTRFPLMDMFSLRTKLKTFSVSHVIEWFEETRIEAYGVLEWPANRSFLRASALKLSLSELSDEDAERYKLADAMNLSKLMLLSLARVDAGVLEPDDVKKIHDIMVTAFGEELLAALRLLWQAAQAWKKDDDMSGLRKLADTWIKLLEDAGHATEPVVTAAAGDGEPAAGGMAGAVAEATEAMEEAAGATEVAAADEAAGQAEDERDAAAEAAADAASTEAGSAKEAASKVFGASTAETKQKGTRSVLQRERPPTAEERAAAVKLANALEKARYRERYIIRRRSSLPPGRLNGRGAMLREAQRQNRQPVTAEPFTTKRRFSTEDPNLVMGLMTDISGSMNKAMEPMAVTNYLMSEAGRRIEARVASVYYGSAVFPGLRPGQHLDTVKIYTAPDSTERFNLAFKALDGKLNLLQGSGARLLVITSDMVYTHVEVPWLKHWLRRCAEAGVAVIGIPVTREDKMREHTKGIPITIVSGAMDPVAVATKIGQAAADQLTRTGARNRA